MKLHLSQGDHSEALAILKQTVNTTPTALPSPPLLTALCEVMESPQDVQAIIRGMLLNQNTVSLYMYFLKI